LPLRLHDFDLQIVRYCAGGSQTGVGRMLAVGVSKLGDGWLYPPLAFFLVIAFGARAWLVVLAGSAATAIGQALLAALKKWRPRLRPYQQATDLDSPAARAESELFSKWTRYDVVGSNDAGCIGVSSAGLARCAAVAADGVGANGLRASLSERCGCWRGNGLCNLIPHVGSRAYRLWLTLQSKRKSAATY